MSEFSHFLRMLGAAGLVVWVALFAIGAVWLVWERAVTRRREAKSAATEQRCGLCLAPLGWVERDGPHPHCSLCTLAIREARALYRTPRRSA